MRVLLSTYGSRGDVEPIVALAVRLQALDCLAIGEVNQQELFGRVAAVVHDGGAGTTTTAARAGAPQVVVAQGSDQTCWAGRVTDLGIGAAHDGPTPTIQSLSAALRTALAPETRARATAVAGDVGTDGARTAAGLLVAGDDGVERPVRCSS
jgi:vancomycin aglycone glucosyltransferase